MKKRFTWHKRSENAKYFWLQLTIIAVAIWLIAGLISFLDLPPAAALIIKLLIGLAPCWLFLFAILTWLEIKRKKPMLEKHPQKIEDLLILLFGLLAIFAEVVFQYSGDISYALPLTVASLAAVGIVRIVAPQVGQKKVRKYNPLQSRFSSGDILKIILFGTFICIIFFNFFKSALHVIQ